MSQIDIKRDVWINAKELADQCGKLNTGGLPRKGGKHIVLIGHFQLIGRGLTPAFSWEEEDIEHRTVLTYTSPNGGGDNLKKITVLTENEVLSVSADVIERAPSKRVLAAIEKSEEPLEGFLGRWKREEGQDEGELVYAGIYHRGERFEGFAPDRFNVLPETYNLERRISFMKEGNMILAQSRLAEFVPEYLKTRAQ